LEPDISPADLLVHALLRLEDEAWNNYRMDYEGLAGKNVFLMGDDPEIARLEQQAIRESRDGGD
jgi:hypothetical protein